jgi:hypothetical protein
MPVVQAHFQLWGSDFYPQLYYQTAFDGADLFSQVSTTLNYASNDNGYGLPKTTSGQS